MRSKPSLGRVYPITHSSNSQSWDHVAFANCLLHCGIRFFQVRDKMLQDGCFYHQLLQIRHLSLEMGAQLIVNDRVDLALAVKADGVHLGQDDLPPGAARKLMGDEAIIGLSTHSWDQFQRARNEPVDYIALGPIFSTGTKGDASPAIGTKLLQKAARSVDIPLVAIGGISLQRSQQIWQAGVHSVAIISEIANSKNPESQVRAFLELSEKS